MGTIAGQQFREGEAWLIPAGGRPFEIEPANPVKFLRHLGAVDILADPQFVHALQRRATASANDGGAVAAHQRIGYGRMTARAIKFDLRRSN